jgi:hypothetical protein
MEIYEASVERYITWQSEQEVAEENLSAEIIVSTQIPTNYPKSVQKLRRLVAGFPQRCPGSSPVQLMWDLWWTKWH